MWEVDFLKFILVKVGGLWGNKKLEGFLQEQTTSLKRRLPVGPWKVCWKYARYEDLSVWVIEKGK